MGVWRSQVARRAFNPLVVGSNPTTPAIHSPEHDYKLLSLKVINMIRNNRSVDFTQRGAPRIGNNKNTRNLNKIQNYLASEGPKSFHQILDFVNTHTTHGITRGSLSNVLGKGPFVKIEFDSANQVWIYDNDNL